MCAHDCGDAGAEAMIALDQRLEIVDNAVIEGGQHLHQQIALACEIAVYQPVRHAGLPRDGRDRRSGIAARRQHLLPGLEDRIVAILLPLCADPRHRPPASIGPFVGASVD